MHFTKMQGAGNDYIYIDVHKVKIDDPHPLAKNMSDRHFGVGSDGIVLIGPSDRADFRMDMYNSDGSRSEMCGNAIRCVGKYVHDRGLTDKTSLTVDTPAGIKVLSLHLNSKGQVETVTVDMGEPVLRPSDIPVHFDGQRMVNQSILVDGETYYITCVSMGNPHAVLFMDEVESLPLEQLGPKFEHHPIFPNRVNTEFIRVVDESHLEMRVWERGAGETLACGTGACASLVASVLNGHSGRSAHIKLLGGSLYVEWREDNHIYMTGGADFVFDGEYNL